MFGKQHVAKYVIFLRKGRLNASGHILFIYTTIPKIFYVPPFIYIFSSLKHSKVVIFEFSYFLIPCAHYIPTIFQNLSSYYLKDI